MAQTTIQKAIELSNWERKFPEMATNLNENYVYTQPGNKYYRIIDNMKGWVEGLFGMKTNTSGELRNCDPNELNEEQKEFSLLLKNNLTLLQPNWWQVALKGNKLKESDLPKFENNIGADNKAEVKEAVYDKLLPAYRTLQESYSKRSWLEWIFNHRQYTAERDALKVVTNMLLTMTGDSVQQLNERYESYKEEVPTSSVTEMQRIVEARKMFDNTIKPKEEVEYEKNLKALENYKEQVKQEEIEEIENKSFDEVTTHDKLTMAKSEEGFEDTLKADLGAVINEKPDKRLAALRKVMLGSHVLNPLLNEAQKFCFRFDTAVDDGYNNESLKEVMREGVNNMFKVALNATKNLKFTDVKDRIVIAQKLTDIMVNKVTPVSFSFHDYTEYGQGFTVLKDSDVIRSEMEGADKAVVNEAIADAKAMFDELYPQNNVQEVEKILVDLDEPKTKVVAPIEQNPSEIKAPRIDK
jgi:hypothetical protein